MVTEKTNEDLKRLVDSHKRVEEKLSQINGLFGLLGTDPKANIDIIVNHTCHLLGGVCCLYNRLDDKEKSLIAWASFNLPPEFDRVDEPSGHICYEATISGKDKPVVIESIEETPYKDTDPNVKKYGLKSYLGYPVILGHKAIGALCIVDTKERVFDETEIHVISTLAKAVSLEEERHQSILALQNSEKRFRTLFEEVPTAIQGYAPDGTIHYWNKASEAVYGYTKDEAIDNNLLELIIPPEMREEVRSTITHGAKTGNMPPPKEFHLMAKDGARVPLISSHIVLTFPAKSPELYCLDFDMTNQKRLEKQLQQAQKLEAIGTMVSGIAHDFNNIMGIILGNTELALDQVAKEEAVRINLNEILSAGRRAAAIVKQLLSSSRKNEKKLEPVEIYPLIIEGIRLLRSTILSTVEIRHNIPGTKDTILADPVQINQVLMNLCINASQAMEESGGRLEISADREVLPSRYLDHYSYLKPGEYVRLSVRDTGQGIDPGIINRIFDPYFTTKETGKGSGMGLSVVHGIVKNHGGVIQVDSELGKGTVFTIFLPLSEKTPRHHPKSVEAPVYGTERILFVDDEQSIVRMAKRMLESIGYKVVGITRPLYALECFMEEPDSFDLVVTDMTMPKMTGEALAKKIKEIHPNIPIIICSGHDTHDDEKRAKELGVAAYISKPIFKNKMSKIIRQVLS